MVKLLVHKHEDLSFSLSTNRHEPVILMFRGRRPVGFGWSTTLPKSVSIRFSEKLCLMK